jgi:hypothetical protein
LQRRPRLLSRSCFLVGLGLASASSAQDASGLSYVTAPPENVTVTGSRVPPDQILHDFIASYTAPSPASGKVARWHDGICPGVAGVPASWQKSVTARVREIAKQVGTPVAPDNCRPNIDIVFTKNPQALLNDVRAKKPYLLGYHDAAQEKRLATVSHALQSWYLTQTVDSQGGTFIDDKLKPPGDLTFTSGSNSFTFPNAHVEYWSGSHLGDERRSELIHVLVVVDLTKVNGVHLSAVEDEVAMLSLAQTAAFDVCQPIPSIANLTAPGCDVRLKPGNISTSDWAYLHALYSIAPTDSLIQQQGKIAFEMKKSLSGP